MRGRWLAGGLALAMGLCAVSAFAVTGEADSPAADTVADAVDITHLVPDALGKGSSLRRDLSAETTAGPADEDWFRFTVSPSDAAAGSFFIGARVEDSWTDPVLEIYAAPTTPTPFASLPVAEDGRTACDPLALVSNDEGEWTSGGSASIDFVPPAPGEYFLRVRPYHHGGEGFEVGRGAYILTVKRGHAMRAAGRDRVLTAIQISRARYADGALEGKHAIVANGYAFPDALAGSALAGSLDAPVLLTRPDRLRVELRRELLRLGVAKVYVLGGGEAVSADVARGISSEGIEVERLPGADRYETALLVAREASSARRLSRVAFVASGVSFPDALAASPMAAHNNAAILLTRPHRLSSAVRRALGDRSLGITDVVIVGGPPAVSREVESELVSVLGRDRVKRISGPDRFATAIEFAIWATAEGAGEGYVGTAASPDALEALSSERLGLTTGLDYGDAVAGGAFCGHARAPMLLTRPDRLPPRLFAGLDPFDSVRRGDDYYSHGSDTLGCSYVFGGPPAVSEQVLLDLDFITGRHMSAY